MAALDGHAPEEAEIVIDELSSFDRAAVAFSFNRLGEQSRYQRFQGIKRELSHRELDYLTVVDHWHHEALIARSTHPRAPIGLGRYVRGQEFDVAEVAIEVVDRWQQQGVGRALMLALRDRALASGIRRFTATMLAENRGSLALARTAGPYRLLGIRHGVRTIEIDLTGDWRDRAHAVAATRARPRASARVPGSAARSARPDRRDPPSARAPA